MEFLNNAAPVPFTCPQCHSHFEKPLGWLEANSEFVCETPGCGNTLKFHDFIRDVKKIEDAASNLLRKYSY